MATIRHILFPFDFSQQGVLAAPFVRAAAQRLDAHVTLFGVVPPVWDLPVAGMPPVMVDTEWMERSLESRLEKALTKELEGVTSNAKRPPAIRRCKLRSSLMQTVWT